MTWRDRIGDDADRMGRPGGDWQGIRPSLDNPMTWSLPLARPFRISVRVHVVFIIYVLIQLARSLASPAKGEIAPLDFTLTALNLGCLFVIVLLHEFGHCFACRWIGGEADEILMWPLGGLAFCRPSQRWRAHLVTAMGGPTVNVVIFIVLAPVLGLVTGRWFGVAIPNPLGPIGFGVLPNESWWLITLVAIQDVSFLLLIFNLLPIFPLDGGRICQALLWPRFGYVRSMRFAVYVGYFGAIALGIFGAASSNWMLVAIAIFGGVTCYVTLRQVQWTESELGGNDDRYAAAHWHPDRDDGPDAAETASAKAGWLARRAEERARKEAAAAAEAADVDRILAKIGREGVGSLSASERSLLERVTERKRREGSGPRSRPG